MHGGEVDGSFLGGNQSIVQFNNDVKPQHTGNRMTMGEIDLFTVENQKIIKDEFFSGMG